MTLKRTSVCLDEFFRYLLKKWKIFVLSLLIGICAAIVCSNIMGFKIVIPKAENYDELKEQEDYFEKYMEESLLMQINPLKVYEKKIYIEHVSNRTALKEYVESGKIWNKFEQNLEKQYLDELLNWDEQEDNQNVELVIQHSEEQLCEELTSYVAEQIVSADKCASIIVGDTKIVADETVLEAQSWPERRLQDIRGELEHTAAGCVIEVSVPIAIIVGILLGGMIGFVWLLLKYLFEEEV